MRMFRKEKRDCVCSLSLLCLLSRDALIEQLMREIVELKEKVRELEERNRADQALMAALRERQMQLEAEIQEYKDIAEQTCNVRGGEATVCPSSTMSVMSAPVLIIHHMFSRKKAELHFPELGNLVLSCSQLVNDRP